MSDYIKREDAIEALGEEPYVWIDDDEFAQGERSQWIEDVSAIKAVPSADRPQGEWIISYTGGRKQTECSVCGKSFTTYDVYGWNYCPWCGAKMKGADDE